MTIDFEGHLHTEEFKVRLRPADAELVRALSRKTGVPSAVILRRWARSEIERMAYSLPTGGEKRRPA